MLNQINVGAAVELAAELNHRKVILFALVTRSNSVNYLLILAGLDALKGHAQWNVVWVLRVEHGFEHSYNWVSHCCDSVVRV